MAGGGRFRAGLRLALCLGLLFAPLSAPVLAKGPESVSRLAAQLSPAVVNISTTHEVPGGTGLEYPQAPDGSPLNGLLDSLNPNLGQGEARMREARSLGSGFVISADGTVVTNNHVIQDADEILVFLPDGTRLPATLVGSDTKTDLAVLKIEAGHPLAHVEFGDSDSAAVGDWVMAIGNPFGLGGSVTLGIVSARNRDIQSGPYDSFIQTDAAINVGNSGGPLFDMNGKVVGINTAIIARGGASLGIGFAVPVNLARPVIEQLAQYGETRRGWLGVGIQDVTDEMAASLGRGDAHGALVNGVTPNGPCAGLLAEGDVIVEFNGSPVVRTRDLPRMVAETGVGKVVPVKVLRGGSEITLRITLGRLETGEQELIGATSEAGGPGLAEDGAPLPALKDLIGFDLEPLSPERRQQFGIGEGASGIVVTAVVSGSDAEGKGVYPGVRIAEVNQKKVTTVLDVATLIGKAKEAGRPAVLFKILDRVGKSRFVAVKVD